MATIEAVIVIAACSGYLTEANGRRLSPAIFLSAVLTRGATVNIVQQGTIGGTRLDVNVTRHRMLARMCRTPIPLRSSLFDTPRLGTGASVAMNAGFQSLPILCACNAKRSDDQCRGKDWLSEVHGSLLEDGHARQ